jgi:hypothetical protein
MIIKDVGSKGFEKLQWKMLTMATNHILKQQKVGKEVFTFGGGSIWNKHWIPEADRDGSSSS